MKSIFRILLCCLLLLGLQELVTPKYMETNPEGAIIREYYDFSKGNDLVFIGDCEVYANFSPVTLWEEYGIPSAIRGSPQQTIWQSCYLLEETLHIEKPRAVIFNVLSMKYDTNESTGLSSRREAYNRMALEGMRWSPQKVKAIFASMTRQERQWESFLTYVFPLLRYHDRWDQLTGEDLRWFGRREALTHNGYLMNTDIHGADEPYPEAPPASYRFGENAWYYLEKMRLLCEEAGIPLVLVKAPSLYPLWHPEWEEQIAAYAGQHGLLYYNMVAHEAEMGIDWATDTGDGGLHLNVYGAEKATAWLGAALKKDLDLPDRRESHAYAQVWESRVSRYYEQRRNSP